MLAWPEKSEIESSQLNPPPEDTGLHQNGPIGSSKGADRSSGPGGPHDSVQGDGNISQRGLDANIERPPSGDENVVVVPLPVAPLPRPLNSYDVAAFIINKMIGSGIFTTPVTVLIMTHNDKGLAFGLWILGFVYTLIRSSYPGRS